MYTKDQGPPKECHCRLRGRRARREYFMEEVASQLSSKEEWKYDRWKAGDISERGDRGYIGTKYSYNDPGRVHHMGTVSGTKRAGKTARNTT